MVEKTFKASKESLAEINNFIFDIIEDKCAMRDKMQLELAIEEIFVNIANYAYADSEFKDEEKTATIGVDIEESSGTAVIVFKDSGVQYNPLTKEDPDTELKASERQIGGLGIFITKKCVDDIKYEYSCGKNTLTIKKLLSGK